MDGDEIFTMFAFIGFSCMFIAGISICIIASLYQNAFMYPFILGAIGLTILWALLFVIFIKDGDYIDPYER